MSKLFRLDTQEPQFQPAVQTSEQIKEQKPENSTFKVPSVHL